jgi:hypothetical protein
MSPTQAQRIHLRRSASIKNSFEKPTRSELLVYNRSARVATQQQFLDAPAYCRCGAIYRLWLVWSRGRSVYDNIRRFLQFQMTVNVVALTLCSIGAITGVGTPLTAVQLIWVRARSLLLKLMVRRCFVDPTTGHATGICVHGRFSSI